MLLMEEKESEEEYTMQCIDIQQQIINTWKTMIKTKNIIYYIL